MKFETRLNQVWYGGESPHWWMRLLAPIFSALSATRRFLYRRDVLRRVRLPVPVIVIGNIAVGGTGKTPLTIYLVEQLRVAGLKPGVISRGYGGAAAQLPIDVDASTAAEHAGDEPVMIASRTHSPVMVHPRRVLAAQTLLEKHDVDVILCDDGLQHYALERDIEIAVIDGDRALGNGRMLPAGPLREPPSRLSHVDAVVVTGNLLASLPVSDVEQMRLQPVALVNLLTGERQALDALTDERCVAVAGIGNPQRFFSLLGELGYSAECRAFPDHHAFVPGDFEFAGDRPVLMTEKDAVKCRLFARPNWWYVEVAAQLGNPDFVSRLLKKLDSVRKTRSSNT